MKIQVCYERKLNYMYIYNGWFAYDSVQNLQECQIHVQLDSRLLCNARRTSREGWRKYLS